MDSAVQVCWITCPDLAEAERIGRVLVEEGLAACTNAFGGMRSCYRWQGELCVDDEAVLLAKARAEDVPALSRRVCALHPAELPCVLSLPVVGGNPAFIAWILAGSV